MNPHSLIPSLTLICLVLVILAGCGPLVAPVTLTPVPTRTPVPIPTPATSISVEVDGSGDYATLAEAVEEAPEGAAILLGPGTFSLTEPLRIRGSRQLIGAGMDETQVVLQTDAPLTRTWRIFWAMVYWSSRISTSETRAKCGLTSLS